MPKLFNLARMTTATTGTGTLTLGSAVAGFLSFASSGIADGEVVTYAIKDGSNSEIGRGTYTASGTTLARTTILRSTNSNNAISLSGSAEVFITPAAEDLVPTMQLGFALGLINGTLVPSVASNTLTIAVKTLAGGDPSSTDPVLIVFRNATAATGNYVIRTLSAATSLVISSGSTLGTANNVPFRVWVVAFDDGGTVRLGAIQRVTGGATPTATAPVVDYALASSTAEGGAGAADSAGVFYTGTAVSSKPYRILGHLDYGSGLATAGTWASAPTLAQLLGPGVPRPGETIQTVFGSYGTLTSNSTTSYADTGLSAAIAPTAAPNLVQMQFSQSDCIAAASSTGIKIKSVRASTDLLVHAQDVSYLGSTTGISSVSGVVLDAPGTTSSTTYKTQFARSGGSSSVNVQNNSAISTICLTEIAA